MIADIKKILKDDKIVQHIQAYEAVVSGEFIFANCIKNKYNVDTIDIFVSSKNVIGFIKDIDDIPGIKYKHSFDGFNSEFIKFVIVINEHLEYDSASDSSISKDSSNYNTSFISNNIIDQNNSIFDSSSSNISSSSSIGGNLSKLGYKIFVVNDDISLQQAIENTYNISVFRMMYNGKTIINTVDCRKTDIDVTEDVFNILVDNNVQKIQYTRTIINKLQDKDIEIRFKTIPTKITEQKSRFLRKTNQWIVKLLIQLIYNNDKKIYRNPDYKQKSILFFKFLNSMKSFQFNELIYTAKIHFRKLNVSKYIKKVTKHAEYKKLNRASVELVNKLLQTKQNHTIIRDEVLSNHPDIKFKGSIKINKTRDTTIDLKQIIGYDMIELEELNAHKYLEYSTDNIVFIYNSTCHLVTIDYVLKLLEDMTDNWFYSCKYPDKMSSITKETPYVKLGTSAGPFLFRWEYFMNIIQLYFEGIRVFKIIDTKKEILYSASHKNVFGNSPDYVSTQHCQPGSNYKIYCLEYYDKVKNENKSI